ncbi:M1 family metallopeptidase [Flavobacteriaceae bacterium XHP0103]|uniref:M1 family metallopeptidase n=1 Tax=Marixanthotalea marina TaxID=2844359 RepID=UPI002989ABC6|nr:M1 family metallopeptidase [Marixanthotalea marina]MBU3822812.1 M1 family metallopeptidase [Marixanthotalea marina]
MKFFFSFFSVFFCCLLSAQQTGYVDFKTAKANINFDTDQKKVFGTVIYDFKITKSVDSIFIDAKSMRIRDVRLYYDGMVPDSHYMGKVVHNYDNNRIWVIYNFEKKKDYKLTISYFSNPAKALYFVGWDNPSASSGQVWTQGQGKYTSNWLPSIDDMNDKIEFDLSITFDKDYEVIANGKLVSKEDYFGKNKWHYDMQNPMSSYLVALAIGKYNKKIETSKSGIPLEMYYYPEDSLRVEPTYRYSKQIFDFLEEEIGVPYAWQNYKQIPVKDFLYAGMENTSATIFSDTYVIDSISFVDKNYVNVNAHELAHQWFGDLVTETSGTHHWLQEGFATYYALLAEKDVFGDDYYYWELYQYAQELIAQDESGGSTSLLNPKSSSTTFYKKGAWVLHMLREQVGDKAFKEAVKNYLVKHQFENVETNDFIGKVEKASGQDLSGFEKEWLESASFNREKAFESLKKSSFMKTYLAVDCQEDVYKCADYLTSSASEETKIKVISQIPEQLKSVDFNNSLKVRQAIAQNLTKIPLKLKADYESLLDDQSYVTIETALYNLWNNFSEDRPKYLNKAKGIEGFNDKNVRILWLALALITEDFEPDNKPQYFEELTGYTYPDNHFEIRLNAFQYLKLLNACNDACKENLEQATKSPIWQFSKFAKDYLKTL